MTLDELRQLLTGLGARPAVTLLSGLLVRMNSLAAAAQAQADALTRRIEVLEERLRQAMDRESGLRAEAQQLADANRQLAADVQRMESHPDVRAAKRAALEAQAAALARRAAALADPVPPEQGAESTHDTEATGE